MGLVSPATTHCFIVAIFLGGAALAEESPASLEDVPFDSAHWKVEAKESRFEPHLGRDSLYLREGIAWVEDSEFTDGVIEFDIAFTDERGFMGVMWRMQDAGNYEEFYLRPHLPGKPDANQYTPAFGGVTSWQLYHGAGYGAPVEYRYDQWNTVRVVVAGDQAEVYVNDMTQPALFIPDQKRSPAAGKVGLNAFFAPAHYSSFRYRSGEPPAFRSAPVELPQAAAGTIMTWEVSDAFDWAAVEHEIELPQELAAARTWTELSCEPSGLANLARVNARGEGQNAVFARVSLQSPDKRTVRLRFGYSDTVRVYLNGTALYAGDNSYLSRDYRYLGTIGYFDELFLPLEPGKNELWLAVGESFGGWGVQAILDDADGVTFLRQAPSACLCPREGRWNAQNLEGKMECSGAFSISRKLKPVKDNGVIFVMEEDCSRVFGDSMTKKEEDTLMIRDDDCTFRGVIEGEEEGVSMVIDLTWVVEDPESIKGEMSADDAQMGVMTCDLYRPYELTYDRPLTEAEYQKWRQRVEKKVEELEKQQK